ncbi:hypothetical protein KM043_018132 [Ampulex compressa]|nr:hypothetical protein KM043_018132 [Ampulex compressa]
MPLQISIPFNEPHFLHELQSSPKLRSFQASNLLCREKESGEDVPAADQDFDVYFPDGETKGGEEERGTRGKNSGGKKTTSWKEFPRGVWAAGRFKLLPISSPRSTVRYCRQHGDENLVIGFINASVPLPRMVNSPRELVDEKEMR